MKRTLERYLRIVFLALSTLAMVTACNQVATPPAKKSAVRAEANLIPQPQKPSANILDRIEKSYTPKITAAETDITETFSVCQKKEVVLTTLDPVNQTPSDVKLTHYVRILADPSQAKTVIIMPPTGGVTPLDHYYAERFCLAGFRIALVESWTSDTLAELDMDMHDRAALRALTAVRHTIEYLKPNRSSQIGILGTSVGAISSALALGYESRIAAGALIVGGGGMPEIIATSTEKTLSKLRSDRMTSLGITGIKDYEDQLRQHVHIEPLDFINLSGKKSVWMMIATKDITVPTKNQFDLYHAFGDQDLLTYEDNHINTILYTAALHAPDIEKFFHEHLK